MAQTPPAPKKPAAPATKPAPTAKPATAKPDPGKPALAKPVPAKPATKPAPAKPTPPPQPTFADRTAAVRDKALADKTAWALLESLTTEVGPRPIGSPAMTRARDWAVEKLTALGFTNVTVEAFTTGAWQRGEESAEVVGPWPQKLAILGLGRSSPTPKEGLSAPIALFATYQAMLDAPPGSLKGKIAVVTEKMRRTVDETGYSAINAQRSQGPIEAAKRGAVGYLVRSLSTDDTRLAHTGLALPGGIPAAALSPPDAELLARMAARGQPVVVRLKMASTFNPAAAAWNVSGELLGRDLGGEVVVIGGHLDSWDVGTGAVDDASGVAITIAAAKIAATAGPLQRTVRVVLWGSEEQGGSGAAYAAVHGPEVGRMVVVGESDLGADAVRTLALPVGSSQHPAMQALIAALPPLKVTLEPTPSRLGGVDVRALIQAGAPFVDINQDASRYFDLHHSNDDTLDKIDPAQLAQNVAVWASFLYTVAGSDIDFRKLSAAQTTGTK